MTQNKYKAKKCGSFDSKKEASRWLVLCEMQEKGLISDLNRQVKYEVIPKQMKDGKVIERATKYIADFVYTQEGKTVVEDVKGYRKGGAYNIFVIKRKLMLERFGIEVKEV